MEALAVYCMLPASVARETGELFSKLICFIK